MRTLPLRTGLFVTMAFSLVLLYLIWWTAYTDVALRERYMPSRRARAVRGRRHQRPAAVA